MKKTLSTIAISTALIFSVATYRSRGKHIILPPPPPPVAAFVDSLTTGACTVTSTMASISVRCSYTNDANANATATIQYKPTSATVWRNAYTPIIDRRANVITDSGTGNRSNAANQNQARGSIVGLTAGTSYDVKLTWTDADTVSGTNPITTTLNTISSTPTANGATYYVDGDQGSEGDGSSGNPFKTITNAITNTANGDTIKVRDAASSYASLTISTSGASGAYRVLINDTGAAPVIAAASSGSSLKINADYWKVAGFTVNAATGSGGSDGSSIEVGSNHNHIYIQNNTGTGVAPNVTSSYHAAIYIGDTTDNIYVLTNTFTTTSTYANAAGCRVGVPPDPCVDGLFLGSPTNTDVIDGNSFTAGASGGFWDGIGNGGNSSITNIENVDISNNTFTDYYDDCTELDGAGINLRFYGNRCTTTTNQTAGNAGTALSGGPVAVGPAYIFRNYFDVYADSSYGFKWGINGPCFIFHNTLDTSRATTGGAHSAFPYGSGTTLRNNIFKALGNIFELADQNTGIYAINIVPGMRSYDYDLLYQTNGADFAYLWQNATTYSTWTLFKSGALVEANSKNQDPAFTNVSTKTIDATSPAYNVGVSLDNFNTRDSIWGYSNAGPDMGAYEVNGFTYTNPEPAATTASRMRLRK